MSITSWLQQHLNLRNKTTRTGRTRRPKLESLESRQLMAVLAPTPFYSVDGAGNNLLHASWGSTGTDLIRTVAAQYTDGISTPAGAARPSARLISNTLVSQSDSILNNRYMSNMVYAWGQFIDHDIDLTSGGTPTQSFNVAVPTGDASFDPNGTGTQVIPLSRSEYDPATGTSTANPRQQINDITSYLDGSMIYGSDATRAAALRTMVGGKLKTSDGNLLGLNTAGLANANDTHQTADNQLFLAGDVRANENIELTSLQTLFVREHNRLADQLAKSNPRLTDEQIYQQARKLVIAEVQAVTFNEFLPALLGPNAITPYRGYNPNVNAGIANEFSTAAFRFGHSMLGDDVEFLSNTGAEVADSVELKDAFFNPNVVKQTGIDPLLKYLASDNAQEVDIHVVDSLRNFLFGEPGQGGLDLASLNIQRGRDHGLADYNSVRAAYGLPKVTSFAQITSDVSLQQKLQSLYGNVNNIDLWVGGLAENHTAGGSLGPTFTRIIADQFQRLRDGDRLWYQNSLSGPQLDQIQHTTLADIIQRNTGLTNLQSDVFFYRTGVSGQVFADVNANGRTDLGERGIAGRTIQLLDTAGAVVATTQTDREGRYYFDQVALGTYKVHEVLPTGAALGTKNDLTVAVTRGQLINNQNFGEAVKRNVPPVAGGVVGAPTPINLEQLYAMLGQDTDNNRLRPPPRPGLFF